MEISYRDVSVRTDADVAITYNDTGTLEDFTNHVIDVFESETSLPEQIGFVSSRFPFLSNLNLLENIILPLEFHRDLNEKKAFEKVQNVLDHLGIGEVVYKRKESIPRYDLLKAMAARAMSMAPGLVFFVEPNHFVSLRSFSTFLRDFRDVLDENVHIWVALEEGMKLSWEHDMEVQLDG